MVVSKAVLPESVVASFNNPNSNYLNLNNDYSQQVLPFKQAAALEDVQLYVGAVVVQRCHIIFLYNNNNSISSNYNTIIAIQ